MRKFLLMTWVAAAGLLAACGGSSLTGSPTQKCTTDCTVTPVATGVSLLTSSPQVASDNTGPATITALAHDANNNAVSGVVVTFAASSGLLAVTSATTDANGQATATLSAGADPTNRSITVTATSGSANATIMVSVIGSSLALTGPQTLVQPGTATYTVILNNAGNVGISGQQVTVASALKNTLSASTLTTDSNGQATFTVTAAVGGADTLTVTGLGLTATEAVTVSTQSFAFTAPAANVNVNIGVVQPVTVVWTNNGAPVAGQTVDFAVTRGTLSAATAITDASGKASVSVSSTTSGPSVITASSTGVSTQVGIEFIATNPTAIDVQASPSTISVSAQSTITAVVRDPSNNLVEGKLVTFSLADVTGGTLSVASALTNNQGVASTIYTASTTTSANNGVGITAKVQGTSVASTAYLTVAGKTTFLSLGTGNTIDVINETEYGMPFAVQAIDNAGNPVTGITVNLKVTSLSYLKGILVYNGTQWVYSSDFTPPVAVPPAVQIVEPPVYQCASEDLNNNGILDPGEDFNNDGILEPGNVAAASPGSVVTSLTATSTLPAGAALVEIVYPKDHSYWVVVTITATATVAGTESSTTSTFLLRGLATDYTSATVAPPGEISPYGVNSCAVPN